MKAKTKKIPAKRSVKKTAKKPELKMVFAIRHGEYNDYGNKELSDYGRQQSRNIGEKLRQMIPTDTLPLVLSSPYTRALQTADIVAECLGSQRQTCEMLRTDEYGDGEKVRSEVLPLVNGSAVLVVVTHYDAPSGVINAFSMAHFKKRVERQVSGKGSGMMIDLETGKVVSDLIFGR